MTTRETIELYFSHLDKGLGWEQWIADDMSFTGAKTITKGKEAYVQTTLGFLSVVTGVEIKGLVIEGENACVEAHYSIVSPKGNSSVCKVAEIMAVRNGKIVSSVIFFDTAAFREFMEKG